MGNDRTGVGHDWFGVDGYIKAKGREFMAREEKNMCFRAQYDGTLFIAYPARE